MGRVNPIELWGPFFAFLTANGGGILRDLIRKDRIISCLSGEIDAEVAVLWGFAFSVFLSINAHRPDPDQIRNAVIIVVCGAFLTRLLTHYLKIPNLKFRDTAA
jgi:polar amino acid transport system substrate-binding protein